MIKDNILRKNSIIILMLVVLIIKGYFLYSVNKNTDFSNYLDGGVVNDSQHYIVIAENIYNYQTFSDTNSEVVSESSAWRPPFWPFILSFFFFITDSLYLILVIKVVLDTILITLVYRKLKHNHTVKNYTFLFLLFLEPYYIKYSLTFLSESITALLIFYLFYLFVSLNRKKRLNILIPITLAIIILCHPVSIFFGIFLLGFYVLFNLKTQIKTVFLHIIIFAGLVTLWPLRNKMVFNKGIFITASQGSSLSKGWNNDVLNNFNNVNGDLADEYLNFKYISHKDVEAAKNSTIDKSKLFNRATQLFFDTLSIKEILAIVWIKVKSNFTPYPEISKNGFLEKLAVIFRILYLIVFVQSIYFLIKKGKHFWTDVKVRVSFFIFSIFIGQLMMAAIMYTGLRFNAIYCLSLLIAFLIFNYDFILKKVINKVI